MMINKWLIGMVSESKRYIAGNVVFQWIALTADIAMMAAITGLLAGLFERTADGRSVLYTLLTAVIAVAVRYICTRLSARMSYLSSKAVKKHCAAGFIRNCCGWERPTMKRSGRL